MTDRSKRLLIRLAGLGAGLLASALVMLATGNDLGGFLSAILDGFGPNLESTLRWYAPLLLAGLAGLIAFRDGAFNLGLDGQIFVGGAAAALVALGPGPMLPGPVAVVLACLAAAVAGAAAAGVCAVLRLAFGTPEVITTLVMNPLCAIVVTLLVSGPLRPAGSTGNTESSAVFAESVRLAAVAPNSLANVSVVLALLVALVVAGYYRFTTWGFESKLFGAAPEFAFSSGVPNVAVYTRAMLSSGGIAGIVGATEVLGVQHRLAKGFNPGLGFDGIAVALVGGLAVGGAVAVAFLFALLRQAGEVSQITLGIPAELVDVMIALIILTTSIHVVVRWSSRRRVGRHPVPPPTSSLPAIPSPEPVDPAPPAPQPEAPPARQPEEQEIRP